LSNREIVDLEIYKEGKELNLETLSLNGPIHRAVAKGKGRKTFLRKKKRGE